MDRPIYHLPYYLILNNKQIYEKFACFRKCFTCEWTKIRSTIGSQGMGTKTLDIDEVW